MRLLRLGDRQSRLLRTVQGIDLAELPEQDQCCGFGGTFSVKFPEVSGGMARTKVESILRTGANAVVSIDSSCLMQLQGALFRAGATVRTMHLAEVLASR
jgi:L-lactate dehydrogenase complex protein LldE